MAALTTASANKNKISLVVGPVTYKFTNVTIKKTRFSTFLPIVAIL